MTEQLANWIKAAKANVSSHEVNILAALNRGDFSTAEKLGGYRDSLVAAIARREANPAEFA